VTDLVVRGIIGEPRSYLSDDEMDAQTDYEILSPVILYRAAATTSEQRATRAVTVTMLGGLIVINRLSFTSRHEALPRWEPGTEGLFLLSQVGSRFLIAGAYYGVFGVSDGTLRPLTKKQGFAPEMYDASVAQASDEIVRRLKALRGR